MSVTPVSRRLYALIALAALLASTRPCRAADVIPFDSERWTLQNAQIVEHLGRTCLRGSASLKDVEFTDGVIEVDIAVDGARAYPGLAFRIQSPAEYERLYLRPHRAGLYPDALQYAPVFNYVCCWQLYHGEGFTTLVDLPADQWIHVRMEIRGEQARVFLGDGELPVLVIDQLKHGASRGAVGVMDPEARSAYFSNFKIELDDNLAFEPAAAVSPATGVITDWEVSKPFDASKVVQDEYPHFFTVFGADWRPAEVEPSGLVNVSRMYSSNSSNPQSVYARTIVRSSRPQTVQFAVGYSDDVTLFLNGRPAYRGQSGYRSRDPSFVGAVGFHDVVFLDLEKGLNEICLLVSDSFGGWGFMGKTARLKPPLKQHERTVKLWETPADFKVPESAFYDAERDILYVSSFNRVGAGKANAGFISRVTLDGEIENLEWITGLDGPCGMGIHEGKLYVVECSGMLTVIDIDAGAVAKKYPAPNIDFLNDVAIDPSGVVYFTNTSRAPAALDLLRLRDGVVETWKTGYDLHRANGIFHHDGALIVGAAGDCFVKRVDLDSGAVSEIACLGAGVVDGIRTDNDGNYLVSRWEGSLYQVSPAGRVVELLDLYPAGMNCADFEFIKENNLLIIPTFLANKVVAYRLTPEE